jgi:sugar lactone lactonase YvrE
MKKTLTLAVLCLTAKIFFSQNVYNFAGTGVGGYNGDGPISSGQQLNYPVGVAFDGSGNLLITDSYNKLVRKVTPAMVISTFAGGGGGSDGGPANQASFVSPSGIAFDAAGNCYISDVNAHNVRKVDNSGIISTVAGQYGSFGYSGDGAAATLAKLALPQGIATDAAGNLYIADSDNQVIRKVNTSGIISTFAGTGGVSGNTGDGGSATAAKLYRPTGVAVDAAGNVFIADSYNNKIRKVNTSGVISTFAGTGSSGYSGDGAAATGAKLSIPYNITFDATGNLYFSDSYNDVVRKINLAGVISTVAGTGVGGYDGDSGPALNAKFNFPDGIAIDATGNLFIADNFNHRVREVCAGNCLAGVGEIFKKEETLLIFPNPNSGTFKVQAGNIKDGELKILNSIGQEVYKKEIASGENEVAGKDLAPGVYLCLLFTGKQLVGTCRINVQ